MQTEEMVAYALCIGMMLFFAFGTVRYARKRKQFKIRQMGRGKGNSTGQID
jgi:hypothetical protein